MQVVHEEYQGVAGMKIRRSNGKQPPRPDSVDELVSRRLEELRKTANYAATTSGKSNADSISDVQVKTASIRLQSLEELQKLRSSNAPKRGN